MPNKTEEENCRFFKIAGITIKVESDIPFSKGSFLPKFKLFEVSKPGEDLVILRHHFYLPDIDRTNLGKMVYQKAPWIIFEKDDRWIYLGVTPWEERKVYMMAVFNRDYSQGDLYHKDSGFFKKGNLHSLTFFPTDQILISQLLSLRRGGYFHSSGVKFQEKGLLFMGHSTAGKSTIVKMLKGKAEILCDDRMIIRKWPAGMMIHGSWSHGEVSDVSAAKAPLEAIFFLMKSRENRIFSIEKKREKVKYLLDFMVKPFVEPGYWNRMFDLVEDIISCVPIYWLSFDKSGKIVDLLDEFLRN